MQAIILAAGIGNRLGDQTGNRPKSLLEFEGKSLLQRHIDNLLDNHIDKINIVTGYQADMIANHLQDSPADIQFISNPRYTEGSLISLGCAEAILLNEPQFILMDADVLYDAQILKRLIETNKQNCLLIDRDFIPGDEPVKVCINEAEQIVEFRKKVAPDLEFSKQGESVGFFKLDNHIGNQLMARVEHYLAKEDNETPYEEAIRDCLLMSPELFAYEDITGLAWIEIDFPEDIIRARKEILPAI